MARLKWSAFLRGGFAALSQKAMTDTLAPMERTNWALSAWNSTPDRNDVPSAWLYGQDHLWATTHLVSSPGEVFPPPSPPPHTTLPSPPLLPPSHPPPPS